MLPLLSSLIAAATTIASSSAPAPVVSVTVFNDRARVVREARVTLHGTGRFALALLPDGVEPGSVRLELSGGSGAQVRQLDLAHLDTDLFPEADARKLLDQLDEADDRIAFAARERHALRVQIAQLRGVHPIAPQPDLRGTAPKLNPAGWQQSLSFFLNTTERLQARVRELDEKLEQLGRDRAKLAAEAVALGASHRRSGTQVTALLSGEGPVRARLTYLVAGASWRPRWELKYQPAGQGQSGETVSARLDGLVVQSTGEAWTSSQLSLSTAIPGAPTALPELLSWRIGQKEQFQPVSHPVSTPPGPAPAPSAAALPEDPLGPLATRERLRAHLLARAGEDALPEEETIADEESEDAKGAGAIGSADGAVAERSSNVPGGIARKESRGMSLSQGYSRAAGPPPPPAPVAMAPPARMSQAVHAREQMKAVSADAYNSPNEPKPAPAMQIGIAPPPSWQPPPLADGSPARLAGGFDMLFEAKNPATLESGSAAQRVPLFAESWPVRTERLVFPGIAEQAWLVAKVTVPANRTLPGGEADLFVGKDPAGDAQLQPMAPGEELTLPLGIDRSIKAVRNVTQLQSEKGVFSKDDVDDYAVTIELANPYAHPIALRVADQLPLKGDDNVEVELVSSSAGAAHDKDTGKLEWAFELPAAQKTQLSFAYRLRRPHGARLHQ